MARRVREEKSIRERPKTSGGFGHACSAVLAASKTRWMTAPFHWTLDVRSSGDEDKAHVDPIKSLNTLRHIACDITEQPSLPGRASSTPCVAEVTCRSASAGCTLSEASVRQTSPNGFCEIRDNCWWRLSKRMLQAVRACAD